MHYFTHSPLWCVQYDWELTTSSLRRKNHTVDIKCFRSLRLGFIHALVTDANYEITSKAAWKKWERTSGCQDFIKMYLCAPLSLISFFVCVFPHSSSKGSSTTVWASMWRTSLTNPTVWLPTIDGFTTNTTLTTLDRYKREKIHPWRPFRIVLNILIMDVN